MGKDYWIKRVEKMNQKNLQASFEETQKALKELYRQQSIDLYDSILRVFTKMQRDAAEKGKIYANDLYRTNSYYQLLNHFNKCAKQLGGYQLAITEDALLKTYQKAQQVVSSLEPKIGVMRPMYQLPSAVDAKNVIYRTWCIDGKNFSDRIWLSKDKLVKELVAQMQSSLARGTTAYDITKALVDRLGVDFSAANRIARTQTCHAQIVGTTNKYKEMGFTHGIFLSKDSGQCDQCAELDGKQFTLEQLQHMIPVHPNCCCSFLLKTN